MLQLAQEQLLPLLTGCTAFDLQPELLMGLQQLVLADAQVGAACVGKGGRRWGAIWVKEGGRRRGAIWVGKVARCKGMEHHSQVCGRCT